MEGFKFIGFGSALLYHWSHYLSASGMYLSVLSNRQHNQVPLGGLVSGNGQWHYFTVVNGLSYYRVYIDGTLILNSVGREDLLVYQPNIGRSAIGVPAMFETGTGTLSYSDLRIWNRALSSEEIAAQVAKGGLVARYTFDDSTQPGRDSSGYDAHLAAPPAGFTWVSDGDCAVGRGCLEGDGTNAAYSIPNGLLSPFLATGTNMGTVRIRRVMARSDGL